jgi:hypothetical protein
MAGHLEAGSTSAPGSLLEKLTSKEKTAVKWKALFRLHPEGDS